MVQYRHSKYFWGWWYSGLESLDKFSGNSLYNNSSYAID